MDNSEILKLPQCQRGDSNVFVAKIKAILRSQGFWTGTNSNDFGLKLEQAVKYFQTTHLGQNGKYLLGDGVVGQKTWWGLYNPQHTIDIPSSSADRYIKLSDSRKKQLAILWQEHAAGVHEIPDGSNGGDGVEKYIVGYGNVPWCALFESWVWKESHRDWPKGHREASVQEWWRKAVAGGYAKTITSSYKPIPGDLLVYLFGGGTGHITAVVAVDADGYEINTIGGNESNKVRLGYRNLHDEQSIAGFINLHGEEGRDFPTGLLSDADTQQLDQGQTR